MSYSTTLIRFVLGEYYEARLPVVSGRALTVEYGPILRALNRRFSPIKKSFTRAHVDQIVSRWRISGGRLHRK